MKIYVLLFTALIIGLLCGSLFRCDNKPAQSNEELAKAYVLINQQNNVIKYLKGKVTHDTIRVTKYKQAKAKIVYRTRFDTLVQVDTVIVELIKCDSVVQIDAKIITAQDSVIYDQSQIIKAQDTLISVKDTLILEEKSDHSATKKELKKVKRKLFFTKVCTVAIVAGTVVLIAIFL